MYAYSHTDALTHADRHQHADPDSDTNPNGDTHADSHTGTRCSYADTGAAYANTYRNTNSDRHGNPDGDASTYVDHGAHRHAGCPTHRHTDSASNRDSYLGSGIQPVCLRNCDQRSADPQRWHAG